jgi:endo-1,4-beta-xylanase
MRARAYGFVALVGIAIALALSAGGCRLRKKAQDPASAGPASGASTQASATHADVAAAPPLRDAAARRGRKIGVALATWFFDHPLYAELAFRQYDSLTAENEMKWYAIEPQPGEFDFKGGDRLVTFAKEHGMRVRGHTLVWHSQLAPYVKRLSGAELGRAMLNHVTTTVEHYRGQIAQWDVVNEALGDDGELRKDSPFTALGPEYIEMAFKAASGADPAARLFYNDYDIEDHESPKSQGAYRLVKALKEARVPIHGVGFQMHVDPRRWPTPAVMQKTLEKFATLGLDIELTEIDVPLGELPGALEQKLAAQKELTRGVVRSCLAVPRCTGMTIWGLTDRHSWLASPEWAPLRGKGPHLALPFDENYQPKPMHAGMLEAFAAP